MKTVKTYLHEGLLDDGIARIVGTKTGREVQFDTLRPAIDWRLALALVNGDLPKDQEKIVNGLLVTDAFGVNISGGLLQDAEQKQALVLPPGYDCLPLRLYDAIAQGEYEASFDSADELVASYDEANYPTDYEALVDAIETPEHGEDENGHWVTLPGGRHYFIEAQPWEAKVNRPVDYSNTSLSSAQASADLLFQQAGTLKHFSSAANALNAAYKFRAKAREAGDKEAAAHGQDLVDKSLAMVHWHMTKRGNDLADTFKNSKDTMTDADVQSADKHNKQHLNLLLKLNPANPAIDTLKRRAARYDLHLNPPPPPSAPDPVPGSSAAIAATSQGQAGSGSGSATPAKKARAGKTALPTIAPRKEIGGSERKTLIVMTGGTGSGKSTVRNAILPAGHNYTVVDADELKDKIQPGYDPANIPPTLHQQSIQAADDMLADALKHGKHAVWDTTGANAKVPGVLRQFAAAGYHIHQVDVNTTKATAQARIAARTRSGIPQWAIDSIRSALPSGRAAISQVAHDHWEIDNNGASPKLTKHTQLRAHANGAGSDSVPESFMEPEEAAVYAMLCDSFGGVSVAPVEDASGTDEVMAVRSVGSILTPEGELPVGHSPDGEESAIHGFQAEILAGIEDPHMVESLKLSLERCNKNPESEGAWVYENIHTLPALLHWAK